MKPQADRCDVKKGDVMRAWWPRFAQDLDRLHLARRLIAHKARTRVITDWTALSRVQVRSLYRQSCKEAMTGKSARHRGPGPQSVGQLLRTDRWRNEASGFISLCLVLEALPNRPVTHPRRDLPDLVRGARLCHAFEIYCALAPGPALNFDQALLLYTAVAVADEVKIVQCDRCDGLMVQEVCGVMHTSCARCSAGADAH